MKPRGPEAPILKSHGLTYREFAALEHVADMDRHGWLATMHRSIRIATMWRLEARVLVRADVAEMTDDYGHIIEPSRFRTCFGFSDAGRLLYTGCSAALSKFWRSSVAA